MCSFADGQERFQAQSVGHYPGPAEFVKHVYRVQVRLKLSSFVGMFVPAFLPCLLWLLLPCEYS